MKHTYSLLSVIAIIMVCSLSSFGFGKVGHATVAKIADNHLTPEVRARIESYLGGKSIVDISSWMDHVRKTDEYKHTDGWHTGRVDKDFNPVEGKVLSGLTGEIAKLDNGAYRNLPDSAVAVGIKLIVHMTGDMHCPSHTRFDTHDSGFTFKINGEEYPFHKFFDSGIMGLSRKGWGYEEYAGYLDSLDDENIKAIQQGSVKEWITGNAQTLDKLYTPLYKDAEYNGADADLLVVALGALEEHQMQIAGYRLAGILNRLFAE